MKKIVYLLVGGILIVTILSRCEGQERKKVEEQLSDFTSLYPMEDLTEFYDLEGYRDEDFAEDDKGTWVINSGYEYTKEGSIYSQYVVLFFNKNKKVALGEYHYDILNGEQGIDEKNKIDIYYKDGKIQGINGEKLPVNIQNYKFLIQYVDLSEQYQNKLVDLDSRFNEDTEIYYIKYEMKSNDKNVNKLKEIFNEETKENMSLVLEGSGDDLKARRELRIDFNNDSEFKVSEHILYRATVE